MSANVIASTQTPALPNVLAFELDNTFYVAAKSFKVKTDKKDISQLNDPAIRSFIQLLGDNLVAVYVGHISALSDSRLVLSTKDSVDFYVLKSKIINTNGLPVYIHKVGDLEFSILMIKYNQYKDIFAKFAADTKSALFVDSAQYFTIETTTIARKETRKIVLCDADYVYMKELSEEFLINQAKVEAEKATKSAKDVEPIVIPVANPWSKPAIVKSTPVVKKVVASSPAVLVPTPAPAPVTSYNISDLSNFMLSYNVKLVDLEKSVDDDDIRDRLTSSISKNDGTLTLFNDKVKITIWNPVQCPPGVCPKSGTRFGCNNVSCSRHTAPEFIEKCKRLLDDKNNDFVVRVRPLIALQVFLFEKKITDVEFIREAVEHAIYCLTDKNLKGLCPLYERAY